jgi:hypothetical protein
MPATTLLDTPPAEQAQMRTIRLRMRYGYLGVTPSWGVHAPPQRRTVLTSISG